MQAAPRHPGISTQQARDENRLRLGGMSLPAVAELGRTQIPVTDAQSLGVGDVIRLDAHVNDPAPVFVGGQPKFLGYPCVGQADTAALQIAGRVPPQFAGRYGTVDEAQRASGNVVRADAQD